MGTANDVGSCLARVRARLRHGSKAETRVARFVLDEPYDARNLSITTMAQACGTSPATVSRFCRALGYPGYRDFQLDLAAAIAQQAHMSLEDFDAGSDPETIVRRVFECNRLSLVETEKVLDHGALVDVACSVEEAERLVFLGIGGSGLVAREGAQRFMSLGLNAASVTDPYEQVFTSAAVGEGDVLFAISHTGQTEHVIEAALVAGERGARTVALTNYPDSRLAGACDVALITAFREHRINAAVSSSRIAQMCVIDSLYFVVASRGRESAARLADEAEERVRKMLRHDAAGRREQPNTGD